MMPARYFSRLVRLPHLFLMAMFGILCAMPLGGCLTSSIEEERTQQYGSMEHVVLLSIDEIENNLSEHFALCGNGRWMKPAKDGESRQIVWGEQVNARTFSVTAWMDFTPLGSGRTQVTAHYVPNMQQVAIEYMNIIVTPLPCH